MKGTATITTTTTITPVVVTDVRNAEVLAVDASNESVIVRGADGVAREFTQGQLDAKRVQIIMDGAPTRIAYLHRGDKLTATIITEGPPVVRTEQQVQATLAQTKAEPSPAKPSPSAVDPASVQALKDMGAFLQALKRFRVSTELTGERVLADGQKLQHTAAADLDVERPNKLRVMMHSARSSRELVYDGKTVTLFAPAQKYYSTVEFTDTIGKLADRMEEKYGVQFPLEDLFLWGTPAAPLDKIESAMNAGQDFIGDDLCDHYAFRQANIDWQIWITTGSKPLPRKVVITNRTDEARPQSVSMIDWNLKPTFKDSVFKFTPPKGATKIEIVPLKTK
jgi:hypothetical protein